MMSMQRSYCTLWTSLWVMTCCITNKKASEKWIVGHIGSKQTKNTWSGLVVLYMYIITYIYHNAAGKSHDHSRTLWLSNAMYIMKKKWGSILKHFDIPTYFKKLVVTYGIAIVGRRYLWIPHYIHSCRGTVCQPVPWCVGSRAYFVVAKLYYRLLLLIFQDWDNGVSANHKSGSSLWCVWLKKRWQGAGVFVMW